MHCLTYFSEYDFLLIYIDKIKTRGLPNDVYSSFNCRTMKITLPQIEIKRIMENEFLMDYLKKFADNNMDNATGM